MAESVPAKSTAPLMNFSRPVPEPSGAYSTVASGASSVNLAIHSFWAFSMELAPAPLIEPVAEEPSPSLEPEESLPPSLPAPHAAIENESARAAVAVRTLRLRVERITSVEPLWRGGTRTRDEGSPPRPPWSYVPKVGSPGVRSARKR